MTARGLRSMVRGLIRTNVTEGTNAAKGLTCVCPTDEAFAAFGDLTNTNANLTDGLGSLLATLTRHGLTGSYYSTNFSDGDLIQSQNGYPILITRRNGSIFLNDARIVGSNFIARTGAVHALDRVMGYLNTTTNVTTPANASIYSDASNIPSPSPVTTAAASSTIASGGAIPTSGTVGSQALPSTTSESGSPTGTATGAAATSTGDSGVSSQSHIAFAGWPLLMAIGMFLV
ncbi:MAG: hypothetical protein Q9167_006789 [Letrouitia subvulpina]